AATYTGYLTNVITPDDVTLNVALKYPSKNMQTNGAISASTWAISGADKSNYTLLPFTAQQASIAPLSITVTVADQADITYGIPVTSIYAPDVPLAAGDKFTGALSITGAKSASGNWAAGTHDVAKGSLAINDGNGGNNYTLTFAGDAFTVAPLTLTHDVTVTPTKVYDGTNAAAYTGGLTNAIAGDKVTLNAALKYTAGKNVQTDGNIDVAAWEIIGTDKDNYTLPSFATLQASITKKPISITVKNQPNVMYGSAITPAYTHSGLAAGDSFGDALAIDGEKSTSGNWTAGTHSIAIGSLVLDDGNGGGNYEVSFTGKTFTVVPRTLTHDVLADPTKVYDGTKVAGYTGGLTNVIADDKVTLHAALEYTAGKQVQYSGNVTASTWNIAGDDAGNYILPSFVARRQASITPLLLTHDVTVTPTKVYDGTTAAAHTGGLTNVIAPDNVALTVELYYTAGKNVQTDGNIAAHRWLLSGSDKDNYTLPVFAPQQASITPKPQTIAFVESAESLNVEQLGGVYTLFAVTDDGVTVKFRTDGSTAAATIDAGVNTLLRLIQTGTATVTAYLDDVNYSASEVSRTFTVVSDNTQVSAVTVDDADLTDANVYVAHCGVKELAIRVTPDEVGSKVLYNGAEVSDIRFDVTRADIYTVTYEVVSSAGNTGTYSLTVESRFDFDELIGKKFNNVLFVNNNPDNNGGYTFSSYEWYKNGQYIDWRQYYSAGDARSDVLDASAAYSVTLTTTDGKVLHTCPGTVTLDATSFYAYPNPVRHGHPVTLEYPATNENTWIRIFDLSGNLVGTQRLTGNESKVSLPSATGIYVISINGASIKVTVE
ncbi:MAG: YDG domain-containing protein, partial [Prevotellaceae bacterium]|nr:YDG domain-containing protein [Prevotellaceae bacterium]